MRFLSARLLLLGLVAAHAVADPIAPDETPAAAAVRLEAALADLGETPPDNASDHLRADLAEVWIAHLRRPDDTAATLALLQPVLDRATAADPADPAFLGRLHHILAQAELANRDANAAAAHYDESVALLTTAHGPADRRTLLGRLGRAVFYSRIGRPADAEAESSAIVAAFQATDPDSAPALQAYGQRAVFLLRLGRFPESEALFRDLLARDDTHHLLTYAERKAYLNNLAYLLNRGGRHAECAAIMEQLAAGDTEAFGRTALTTLKTRFNLAYVYGDLGRFDEADTLLREDLALVEPLGAIGTLTPADYLGRLGQMALKRGDPAAALPDLTRAVALLDALAATTAVHQEDATRENLRASLALAQSTAGDSDAATATLATWLTAAEERFRARLNFTSEADRLAFAARERPLDLPATLGEPTALARAVLRFKGLVLDSILEDQRLALASTDPVVAQLLTDYQAALDDSAANQTDPLLGSRREQLERELARRTLTAADHRRALLTDPAAVLAALPPDTALVEYVHHRDLTPGQPTAATDAYLALIGTATHGWQITRLGPAAELDPDLARYRILVRRGGDLDWARAVRARVLDPVRTALPSGITRLLIAPDGPLHQIAFASLPEADDTFVLEHLRIQLLDTGRDLVTPPAPATVAERPLVLAAARPTDPNLPTLPGADHEAAAVAALLPQARLRTGDDATPAVLAAAGAPRWLHIASHAITPADPALNLGERLRRTGLALQGDDSFLSTAQIAGLDLHATDVAFLSACDSGGGESVSGEGVLGLRRGFTRAGARNLVLTLWPVADDAALPLITRFYAALPGGTSPAEALNQAQRHALSAARAAGTEPTAILRTIGAYTLSGTL